MNLPLPLNQLVVIALLIMNGFTFSVFGFDKWMAQTRGWRIPEAFLWLCSLLGGSVGALAAMNVFRHKTRKLSFQLVMVLILLLQAVGIWFLFSYTTDATISTTNAYYQQR